MAENLTPRAIIPMKQTFEAGCVPTSVSMVFSGFGIEISEQTLVAKYFPTASLPAIQIDRGVTNTDTVKGIVQILNDLGLEGSLQLDVFAPSLYQYTRSPQERYIVKATPGAARKFCYDRPGRYRNICNES